MSTLRLSIFKRFAWLYLERREVRDRWDWIILGGGKFGPLWLRFCGLCAGFGKDFEYEGIS